MSVTETATSDNAGATATAQVAAEQTMTAVATDTNQSFPTPTAAPSPTSDNAGATATAQIAAEQTMTAVATDTNQSFPTTIATPTSSSGTSSPLLELDKTSLHASSDCTTSANADGNNHSGWICALTLTNPGATDLNWTSNPSSSTVGIYVQDTQTWNQGIVLAGQQQHVDFVVQGDTSACSGSYALTLNSSANPISVTWDC